MCFETLLLIVLMNVCSFRNSASGKYSSTLCTRQFVYPNNFNNQQDVPFFAIFPLFLATIF